MKMRIFLWIIIVFSGFVTYGQHPSEDPNWRIVIQDEFTSSFNYTIWKKENGTVHYCGGAEEPQIYTANNVYISDGKLVLRTIYDTSHVHPSNNCQYEKHIYTSGEITSKNLYKYGYFEIRAKLPIGQGYWPAFWLHNSYSNLQTSNCWYNEIDIFEGNGCISDSVTCNVHWKFDCPLNDSYNDIVDTIPAFNYSQTYHWYGLEWNENEITWYVDRQKVRSIPNNVGGIGIQNPMKIYINSALIPPSWSCGTDNSNIVLPNYMFIDAVNVYQLICDKNTVANEIDYDSYIHGYGIKKSITLSGASSLSSGQNVFLKATDFIELKDGFVVPNNAQLYLHTTTCE